MLGPAVGGAIQLVVKLGGEAGEGVNLPVLLVQQRDDLLARVLDVGAIVQHGLRLLVPPVTTDGCGNHETMGEGRPVALGDGPGESGDERVGDLRRDFLPRRQFLRHEPGQSHPEVAGGDLCFGTVAIDVACAPEGLEAAEGLPVEQRIRLRLHAGERGLPSRRHPTLVPSAIRRRNARSRVALAGSEG